MNNTDFKKYVTAFVLTDFGDQCLHIIKICNRIRVIKECMYLCFIQKSKSCSASYEEPVFLALIFFR